MSADRNGKRDSFWASQGRRRLAEPDGRAKDFHGFTGRIEFQGDAGCRDHHRSFDPDRRQDLPGRPESRDGKMNQDKLVLSWISVRSIPSSLPGA